MKPLFRMNKLSRNSKFISNCDTHTPSDRRFCLVDVLGVFDKFGEYCNQHGGCWVNASNIKDSLGICEHCWDHSKGCYCVGDDQICYNR